MGRRVKTVRPNGRRIPTPAELKVLRVLKSEKRARAVELVEASKGKIPRAQAWVLLSRLRARGALSVIRRVDNERGGLPVPVYELTRYGHIVIRAMDILEAA